MTAVEIIQEIKRLPQDEQDRVIEFVRHVRENRPLEPEELGGVAKRMVETKDPAEADRLQEEIARGFCGEKPHGHVEQGARRLEPRDHSGEPGPEAESGGGQGAGIAMRKAEVCQLGRLAGILEEADRTHYRFTYAPGYEGEPVSLALPVRESPYEFDRFPPVFEGLLPEGLQLEALLRTYKLDRGDFFQQLLLVGLDVVGSLTVREAE